ncbi:NYN domain-containing protein [Sporosarcina sp. PTS2304]|uniref:NYN domain-containing protein n=1 Tax=Sporosarcina sp. PTS2304 TaxID=2283194 RepID=UPI000E0CD26A|nr:NYN domain-containing protein [Sporosarcina sp. PTS2304]AXI00429.1 NYN domain-containing protein [Sporosarcina sp. PTS2304]
MKKDVLLVDGYNIIGAWPELQKLKKRDFAQARDLLIEQMAEFQAHKGWRVIVVFDAHLVPGIEKRKRQYRVEVVFTRENETADERIEKLVSELSGRLIQIHVATSDLVEQWVVFAQGALRISARELEIAMKEVNRLIAQKVKDSSERRPFSKIPLSDEVAEAFEKMRRGE